jgi:plasmid stabilization system protein ParE
MPARHTLRYLPSAQHDLLLILDFIAQDSPNRAGAFVDKLDERIGALERHPMLGRIPLTKSSEKTGIAFW